MGTLHRSLACIACLSSAVLLSACGSGNGNSGGDPDLPHNTVGGTVSGLAGGGLLLHDNGGDPLLISGNGAFTFPTPPSSASYRVTVAAQPSNPAQTCTVGGGAGTLAGSDVTNVAVNCHNWGRDVLIDVPTGGSTAQPKVAVDPNGNAIAVWTQLGIAFRSIWANRYTAGSGWGTAELLETDDRGHADGVEIAVDSAGNGIAVWVQDTRIFANRYTAGVGWDTAAAIDTISTGNNGVGGQRIVFDPAGNAIAVWEQSLALPFPGKTAIWANRYTAGAGWGTSVQINPTVQFAQTPQVGVAANGNAVAVWTQEDTAGVMSVWANRFTAGGGWGTPVAIESNSTDSLFPSVAVDPAGNATVVWQRFIDAIGTRDIWANRFAAGGGWGTAERLATADPASFETGFPMVAVDPAGNAIALWDQMVGSRRQIRSSRYAAGSAGWTLPITIDRTDMGDASSPKIAFDPAGNAFAVWQQNDGARASIFAGRFTPAGGWGVPGLIETHDSGNGILPEVAVDAGGNAFAVWQVNDVGRNKTGASRFQRDP